MSIIYPRLKLNVSFDKTKLKYFFGLFKVLYFWNTNNKSENRISINENWIRSEEYYDNEKKQQNKPYLQRIKKQKRENKCTRNKPKKEITPFLFRVFKILTNIREIILT